MKSQKKIIFIFLFFGVFLFNNIVASRLKYTTCDDNITIYKYYTLYLNDGKTGDINGDLGLERNKNYEMSIIINNFLIEDFDDNVLTSVLNVTHLDYNLGMSVKKKIPPNNIVYNRNLINLKKEFIVPRYAIEGRYSLIFKVLGKRNKKEREIICLASFFNVINK